MISFEALVEMKGMKIDVLFVLGLCSFIFLDNTCYSQFHWGKNHRLAAERLRQFLKGINPSKMEMEAISQVRVFKRKISIYSNIKSLLNY